MFDAGGQLKEPEGLGNAPRRKSQDEDEVRWFPEVSGINIREDCRYGSLAERARLRKDFPQYVWYFESKEATKIPKLPKLAVKKTSKETIRSLPAYPCINQQHDYAYGTPAHKARLRKDLPVYEWYFDEEDKKDKGDRSVICCYG